MEKLTNIVSMISKIFSDNGLDTEQGNIKCKKLDFSIFEENGVLTIDFLNSLPEITVSKNLLITTAKITVNLTKIQFIDNNEIKLFFDSFPFHRTIKYE